MPLAWKKSGREGGREGRKEGGKEGGREGRKEGGREGGVNRGRKGKGVRDAIRREASVICIRGKEELLGLLRITNRQRWSVQQPRDILKMGNSK